MSHHSIQEMASRLKHERVKKQLSQNALAAKIGIPQSHISKIESGKTNPRLGMVIEIARVLDCELLFIPKKYSIPIESLLQSYDAQTPTLPAYTLKDDEDIND